MTGTRASLVGSLAGRRRPDPEAVAVVIGAAAGAGLIKVAPAAVPLLALGGVETTVALSWQVGATRSP